jgi:hypothetical protein
LLIKGEMEGDIEDGQWQGQQKAVKLGLTQRLFGILRTERHGSTTKGSLRMITERNGEKYGPETVEAVKT